MKLKKARTHSDEDDSQAFDSLPEEIIDIILHSTDSLLDRYVFRNVCRTWWRLIPIEELRTKENDYEDADQYRIFGMFKPSYYFVYDACRCGYASLVKWMLGMGFRFDLYSKIECLKGDIIEVMEYAFDKGILSTETESEVRPIFDLAASYGGLRSLRWLISKGFKIPSSAVNVAASYGKLDALKLLVEAGAYWDYENIVRIACEIDRPDMHKYMFDKACEQADHLYKYRT
jgi:hypothetical protein